MSSSTTVALRATALAATLTLSLGAVAHAATASQFSPSSAVHIRAAASARANAPSPQWIQSHLAQFRHAERGALGGRNTAPYPLDGPWALTVGPGGNLFVANEFANQVLMYNSNLQQQTARTITTAISFPTGMAVDSIGELYVSSITQNDITVYSAGSHTYLPNRTITSNVYKPVSIAIDGLDNLYVDDNFSSVGVYAFNAVFLGNLGLISGTGSIDAVAQHAHFTAVAGSTAIIWGTTTATLENLPGGGSGFSFFVGANMATGAAFDAGDNLYYVSIDRTLNFWSASNGAVSLLTNLSFTPQAIAVDSAHNHIFVSDFQNNAIAVFNLNGQLLTTLH